jgi:hypothetical protein
VCNLLTKVILRRVRAYAGPASNAPPEYFRLQVFQADTLTAAKSVFEAEYEVARMFRLVTLPIHYWIPNNRDHFVRLQ